jgi:hypothetical protein
MFELCSKLCSKIPLSSLGSVAVRLQKPENDSLNHCVSQGLGRATLVRRAPLAG